MKPTGLRERTRAATHKAIWESALRLFVARGYDNVTIEDIAEQCGVSPRTIYRYFGTKEDLLFAGSDARQMVLLESIERQPAESTPFDALAAACLLLAEDYAPDRDLIRARAAVVAAAPSLQQRSAAQPREWDAVVINAVRVSGRADGTGELDLALLVGAAMTAVRICVDEWLREDSDANSDLIAIVEAAFARLRTGFAGR